MPEASWTWLFITLIFIFALADSTAVVKNVASCYKCISTFGGVGVKENERDRECEGLTLPQKYLHTGNISELGKNDSFVCKVTLDVWNKYENDKESNKQQRGPTDKNVEYYFAREMGFDSDYEGYPLLPSKSSEKFLCYRHGYERITEIPNNEFARISCACTTNQCNGILNVEAIMKKYANATEFWPTFMALTGVEEVYETSE